MNCKIKKGAAAIFGAVAMMGAVSSANAASGQYLGAQLAIADVPGQFSSGTSFVGTFGMPLPQVNPNVAFEAEFSKALSKPSYFGYETDYYTLAGYGVYNIPANQQLNIRLRAGLAYEHLTWDLPWFAGTTASYSSSSFGLSVGAGITFKISPTMNLIAEYTDIQGDIDHLSAGLQFMF